MRSHQHMRHFSGNFWWTTAAYYRTLPDVIAIDDYVGEQDRSFESADDLQPEHVLLMTNCVCLDRQRYDACDF